MLTRKLKANRNQLSVIDDCDWLSGQKYSVNYLQLILKNIFEAINYKSPSPQFHLPCK